MFWGRFLPVLRSVVSIPAGLANMKSIRFAGFTAGGTVGFYPATGSVVYYGRQQSLFATAFAVAANNSVLAAIGILVLPGIRLLIRYRSSRQNTER